MLKILKRKKTIRSISDCIDCQKGRTAVVIGAGGMLREHENPIKKFLDRDNVFTIGINNMTAFHVPTYHLWTNKQRWRDFGSCIDAEKSKLMFGASLPQKLIRKHFKGDYITVNYLDEEGIAIDYKDGIISGCFRTAGCLAVLLVHLFGAAEIYIAGMDGYTLHEKEKIEDGSQSHHVYGKGFTDDSSWEKCLEKDRLVYENLNALDDYGVKFRIITPTKFEKFYDNSIL
jgi:hypothetical protein